MPFCVEVRDDVRAVIDDLATRHGMTREQVVRVAVSALLFFDDRHDRGEEIVVADGAVDWATFMESGAYTG